MFQLAAAASLAHEMSLECYACPRPGSWVAEPDSCCLYEYVEKYKSNLFRNFHFVDEIPRPYTIYNEVAFGYHPLPHEANICLHGYFQSERYFNKPLVRHLFQMEDSVRTRLEEKYGTLLRLHPISINVRRGDYLRVEDYHPVQPFSYFEAAIACLGADRHFLVTSDDTVWCRENFAGSNFHVIDDVTPVENLYLQSMCYGHIISNSTYSWWGAWLDPKINSPVVAPKRWFGPRLAHLSIADLIPHGWDII
ncbi:MAG: alpha-1,2-fucosyltransferase [Bacteroidaceae bacterium]|nr:alpha-1,2-fucosyltransferase [Bacteroidaceae bacterium]